MSVKILAALLALTALPAFAQEKEPARYQLISVSGGFVRLDAVTGEMTFCRDEVDSFRCSPISTDAAKMEVKPEAGARLQRDTAKKDDSAIEDFDKALTMMERAMKSFMAMTQENPKECAL
jgi:hypothetical protein